MKASRSKPPRKPGISLNTQSRVNRGSVERRLAGILKDLARVLVTSGYGISGMSRLTKRAYFDAALELDAAAGRRKNHARIAAATGLTRAEVSQMSRKPPEMNEFLPVNRAHRVSLAWTRDRAYCASSGKPNVLPFAGKHKSFESLVKDYSGDIPARAMFSEMRRLRMIREDSSKNVQLVRASAPVSRRTDEALRALSPWVGFLSQISEEELFELNSNSIQISLAFESMPQLFAAVRELQSRASAFVNSIQELNDNKKSPQGYRLDISFVLGTRIPNSDEFAKKIRRRSDG